MIFSLSFLMVCSMVSERLSALRMAAVDSPLLYLLKMSFFCSMVIDVLDFFLPKLSFLLRSHFGAMMHNNHKKKKKKERKKKHKKHCANTKEDDRENTNNAAYKNTRGHIHAIAAEREKGCCAADPSASLVNTPSPCLPHSIPLTSWHTRMRPLGSLMLVGFAWVRSDFVFSAFTIFRRLTL